MREKLGKMEEKRLRFIAEFERYGTKNAYRGPHKLTTLLFKNVRLADSGQIVTDHIWFTDCKAWNALHLQPGESVAFDARVKGYLKGYKWWEKSVDFKLSHPTKIEKLG